MRIDPLAALPTPRDLDAAAARQNAGALAAAHEGFVNDCTNALTKTLMDVRRSRAPRATAWDSGLPLFLCGGGAPEPLVRQAIQEAGGRLGRAVDVAPLRTRNLPIPDNFDRHIISAAQFQRLAVAFGLSYDSFDIGEMVPPSEIPDIRARRNRRWESEFVGKEMV